MARSISYLALAVALSNVAFASIFIRLAGNIGVPPLVIAFWRQLLATIGTIFLAYIFNHNLKNVKLPELRLLAISGLFLGLHFGTWFVSLSYTTVALSVTIVDSAPLFVVIGAYIFLDERISRNQILGIGLALVGGLILGLGSLAPIENASNPVLGIFLALIGSMTVAVYFLFGRLFRKDYEMKLFTYTAYVYGFSTITLFIIVLILNPNELLQSFTGNLPWEAYMLFVLLAIGPSILGHTLYNFALKDIKTVIVSLVLLGEPILSTILAIFILDEIPSQLIVIGALITLIGIGLILWAENRNKPSLT